jgi:hypothetical protein
LLNAISVSYVARWVTDDKAGVGADARLTEAQVLASDAVAHMIEVATRVASEERGEAIELGRFYNQYHQIETWA